jgi:hypothetical protein
MKVDTFNKRTANITALSMDLMMARAKPMRDAKKLTVRRSM